MYSCFDAMAFTPSSMRRKRLPLLATSARNAIVKHCGFQTQTLTLIRLKEQKNGPCAKLLNNQTYIQRQSLVAHCLSNQIKSNQHCLIGAVHEVFWV